MGAVVIYGNDRCALHRLRVDSKTNPYCSTKEFCCTIFNSATIDGLLATLPEAAASSVGDYVALIEIAYDNSFQLIGGFVEVGDAVVLYEPCGHLCDEEKRSLSAGRTVISNDGNPAVSYFQLFRNGTTVTRFEKIFAHSRDGDEPDALLPLMEQVGGFDLHDAEDDEEPGTIFLGAVAACAFGCRSICRCWTPRL